MADVPQDALFLGVTRHRFWHQCGARVPASWDAAEVAVQARSFDGGWQPLSDWAHAAVPLL